MDYIHRGDRVKDNETGREGTVIDIYFGRYAPTIPMVQAKPDNPKEFGFSGRMDRMTKI